MWVSAHANLGSSCSVFCIFAISMLLLSFFSAIKRHQGAPLRVYRKMMSESGSQSVVLYARVCVCLWSSTFESRLYNLLCLDSQPFWSWVGHLNPIGRRHRVFLSLRLNPAPPSSGRLGLWCCGGSVCSVGRSKYGWPRWTGPALGAVEIEPSSVTDRTLPWENTTWLPSPQIWPADPSCIPPEKRENTYFCPSWEIWAWIKAMNTDFEQYEKSNKNSLDSKGWRG